MEVDLKKKITTRSYLKDKEIVEEVEENYLTAIAELDKTINCRPSTSQPPKPTTTLTKKLPPISIKCFEDNYTARAYQLERDHDAEPKVEEFLKFIEKRASAMENVEQGHQARPGSKVAAHASTGKAISCSYCAVTNSAYLFDAARATGSKLNTGASAVA